MTKKQAKEKAKQNRVWFPMNLGTRTHKNPKDYNRKDKSWKKEVW